MHCLIGKSKDHLSRLFVLLVPFHSQERGWPFMEKFSLLFSNPSCGGRGGGGGGGRGCVAGKVYCTVAQFRFI